MWTNDFFFFFIFRLLLKYATTRISRPFECICPEHGSRYSLQCKIFVCMTRRYFDDDLYRYDEDRWVASDSYFFFLLPLDMNSLGRQVHKCSNRHFEWFCFIGIPYRRLSTVYISDGDKKKKKNAPFGNISWWFGWATEFPSCRHCSFVWLKSLSRLNGHHWISTDVSVIFAIQLFLIFPRNDFVWLTLFNSFDEYFFRGVNEQQNDWAEIWKWLNAFKPNRCYCCRNNAK